MEDLCYGIGEADGTCEDWREEEEEEGWVEVKRKWLVGAACHHDEEGQYEGCSKRRRR